MDCPLLHEDWHVWEKSAVCCADITISAGIFQPHSNTSFIVNKISGVALIVFASEMMAWWNNDKGRDDGGVGAKKDENYSRS